MDTKYIVGLVVLVAVIVIVMLVSIGILISKSDSIGSMRFMMGKSKLDKLIDKINNYLNS